MSKNLSSCKPFMLDDTFKLQFPAMIVLLKHEEIIWYKDKELIVKAQY